MGPPGMSNGKGTLFQALPCKPSESVRRPAGHAPAGRNIFRVREIERRPALGL